MAIGPLSSKKKILIVVLVILFAGSLIWTAVISAFVFSGANTSIRFCNTTEQTGISVSNNLKSSFDILTYDYTCLTNSPPTAKGQRVDLSITSDKSFASIDEAISAIAASLTKIGWQQSTTPVDSNSGYTFNGPNKYTLSVTVSAYSPLYASLVVRPNNPKMSFGFTNEQRPATTRLTSEDALRFLKVPAYKPAHIPTGYSSWDMHTIRNGIDSVEFTLNKSTDVENDVSPALRTSMIPEAYDITKNCNVLTKTSYTYTCDLLLTTPNGRQVYVGKDSTGKYRTDLVAIVDGYLVQLLYGYKHIYVTPQLSDDDISKIFETLSYTNTPAKY